MSKTNPVITYPPEMLPSASEEDEAEVVAYCGSCGCEDGRQCERKIVIKEEAADEQ